MEDVVKKFLKKVDKSAVDDCWNWTGSTGTNGYGQFWCYNKIIAAHRVSYELFKGPIAEGLFVLHKCDNPRCVNPNHLFLGTQKDNMKDASEKGRLRVVLRNTINLPRGEKHHASKLTETTVKQARKERAEGATIKSLADKYGITVSVMWRALTYKTWKEV